MEREDRVFREVIEAEVSVAHKRTSGNPGFPYHRHNGCEIYLFLGGDIRFFVEQTCFTPAPGTLIVLNQNEMHRVAGGNGSEYERITVNLQQSYIERLSLSGVPLARCFLDRPLGERNVRKLTDDETSRCVEICQRLRSCAGPDRHGFDLVRRDAYTLLLLAFVNDLFMGENCAVDNQMPVYIRETMAELDRHSRGALDLARIAQRAGLHPSYLSAQFKRYTGLTPRDYAIDRKLAYAKALLGQGKNVTEACYAAGFNDYANFLRTFKRKIGVSPGEFRKRF